MDERRFGVEGEPRFAEDGRQRREVDRPRFAPERLRSREPDQRRVHSVGGERGFGRHRSQQLQSGDRRRRRCSGRSRRAFFVAPHERDAPAGRPARLQAAARGVGHGAQGRRGERRGRRSGRVVERRAGAVRGDLGPGDQRLPARRDSDGLIAHVYSRRGNGLRFAERPVRAQPDGAQRIRQWALAALPVPPAGQHGATGGCAQARLGDRKRRGFGTVRGERDAGSRLFASLPAQQLQIAGLVDPGEHRLSAGRERWFRAHVVSFGFDQDRRTEAPAGGAARDHQRPLPAPVLRTHQPCDDLIAGRVGCDRERPEGVAGRAWRVPRVELFPAGGAGPGAGDLDPEDLLPVERFERALVRPCDGRPPVRSDVHGREGEGLGAGGERGDGPSFAASRRHGRRLHRVAAAGRSVPREAGCAGGVHRCRHAVALAEQRRDAREGRGAAGAPCGAERERERCGCGPDRRAPHRVQRSESTSRRTSRG